ncbi:hypothetical protein [Pedobacter sp. MW01-1-1]|uniref:hypothetical protein n=1 Tax=Pedobacter sp. MW01-1-1 TaxID=3383027 RepID=UPI003FED4E57
MKPILTILFIVLNLIAVAQTSPASNIRGDDSFTQVDNYANIIKRLGIPSGPIPTLSATIAAENTIKLFFDTSLGRLKVYNPINASWIDAMDGVGKLITPRTIWGQTFDGSTNLSGAISGISTIQTNGNIGLGIGPSSFKNMLIGATITGSSTAYNQQNIGVIQPSVTGMATYYSSLASTLSAAFNVNNIMHYQAEQGVFGAGSTVSNQYGFYVSPTLTGATNNFGFYGDLSAAPSRYNLYMAGSAQNYINGKVGIKTLGPLATFDIGEGSGFGLILGADNGTAVRTNNVSKVGRMGSPHYINAKEPVTTFLTENGGTDNIIKWGGGTISGNAATKHSWYVGANNTTLFGTEVMTLNNTGLGIGTTTPTEKIEVNGNVKATTFIGNLTGSATSALTTNKWEPEGVSDLNTPLGFKLLKSINNTILNQPGTNEWVQGIQFSSNNDANYINQLLATVNGSWSVRSKQGGNWGQWDRLITASQLGAGKIIGANTTGNADGATKLQSTTHSGTFWLTNYWDGTYWQLISNHGAAVNVAHADNANSYAGLSGDFSGFGTSISWLAGKDVSGKMMPFSPAKIKSELATSLQDVTSAGNSSTNNIIIKDAVNDISLIFEVKGLTVPSIIPSNFGGTMDRNMSIAPFGGNVGIGTTNPSEKLSVNGKIKAKELKIEPLGWSDYVFDEGYKITSLIDLEKFIKLNKHLPEVPSAKEVESNGIEVGEMNKLLLKKIEELTLYMIEMKKENIELKNRLTKIENK